MRSANKEKRVILRGPAKRSQVAPEKNLALFLGALVPTAPCCRHSAEPRQGTAVLARVPPRSSRGGHGPLKAQNWYPHSPLLTPKLYETDRSNLLAAVAGFGKQFAKPLPKSNDKQHAARHAFDPIAEAIRGLVKHLDRLYKLAARSHDLGAELAADDAVAAAYDRRATARLVKELDGTRKTAVEQLKQAIYFHRQVSWLQDRFPDADRVAVPGLVKLVDRKEIELAHWILTPGRYVGAAPPEQDEDFDFEQTFRDIHTELLDLNKDAAKLAMKIQQNFEELGA